MSEQSHLLAQAAAYKTARAALKAATTVKATSTALGTLFGTLENLARARKLELDGEVTQPPAAPTKVVGLTAVAGPTAGSVKLSWTNPAGATWTAVRYGRDGADSNGFGPWESEPIPMPVTSGDLVLLISGATYNLWVEPVGGERTTIVYKVPGTPPPIVLPPVVSPPAPAFGPRPVAAPAGAVLVSPGQSIQSAIDSKPDGSTFFLTAGLHAGQEVRPRTGTKLYAAPGAILDGQGRQYCVHPTADLVELHGLTIKGYKPGAQYGAVQGGGANASDGRRGWLVEDCTIRENDGGAVRLGHQMKVRRCLVTYNTQIGVTGIGDDVLVEANEISYNNPTRASDPGWEAGGTKFVLTNHLICRGNWSHHNVGPGLWTDWNNRDALYEDNVVEDNDQMGIFHEVSFDAIIRNNTVRRNGLAVPDDKVWLGSQVWGYGAGIEIAASSDVQVYGNTVEDNWNGIMGIQQDRGAGHDLRNLDVHDNDIVVSKTMPRDGSGHGAYAAGIVQDTGDPAVFTGRNNRFHGNRYRLLDPALDAWTWNNQRLTLAQWTAAGQS